MQQPPRHPDPVRDQTVAPAPPQADDRFARQSFTFRRMKGWQVAAMGTVVVVLFGLVLLGWMA